MNKQQTYWVFGIAAAIIIILLIIFGMSSSGKGEVPSEEHSESTIEALDNSGPGADLDPAGGLGEDIAPGEETQNPAVVKADEALADYLSAQETIMNTMIENMNISSSNNAALDFLRGMIPHHEAAIEMSEAYLEYGGNNPDLKQIAEDVISVQKEEISLMKELITSIESSGEKNEEKAEKYMNVYSQMMSGHEHMSHGLPAAQDIEQAFAEGMIMHHQMAIDMSEAIMEYTDNEVVLQLAEDMTETQEDEIQIMKDVLVPYH